MNDLPQKAFRRTPEEEIAALSPKVPWLIDLERNRFLRASHPDTPLLRVLGLKLLVPLAVCVQKLLEVAKERDAFRSMNKRQLSALTTARKGSQSSQNQS